MQASVSLRGLLDRAVAVMVVSNTAWAEGRVMIQDQAIAFALEGFDV